jgi:hypothetical protein
MLAKTESLPFESVICQDIESTFTFDCKFNSIICVGVMDCDSLLLECRRQLADFNCIGMTLPETKSDTMNAFTEQELEALVTKCGFTILKCERIVGYTDSETHQSIFYWALLMTYKKE